MRKGLNERGLVIASIVGIGVCAGALVLGGVADSTAEALTLGASIAAVAGFGFVLGRIDGAKAWRGLVSYSYEMGREVERIAALGRNGE